MIARLRSPQVRAVIGSLGSSLWIQAFVLVSGVIAARLLGPEDRGYLALIWTVALVVTQLGTLGLPLAVTMEIARGRATTRSILQESGRAFALQTAAVIGVHAVAVEVLLLTTEIPAGAAWTSLAVSGAILTQSFALATVQGRSDFRTLNRLRVLPVALYSAALVVLVSTGNSSLLAVTALWVGGYLGAAAFAVAAVHLHLRRSDESPSSTPHPTLSGMRRFGLRSLFGWASPTETFRVDQLIVGFVLSAHSLGLYVAALAFTNLPRFFAQGIGLMAYPAVAAADGRNQARALVRYTLLGSTIAATTCGLLALLAHPLITIAFGPEFTPAVGPLRVLLIASALLCVRRVLTDALRGAGHPGAGSRAEGLSWLILIPSMVVLAAPFGLDGVALSLCCTYAVSLGVLAFTAYRVLTAGPSPSGPTDRCERPRARRSRLPFLRLATPLSVVLASACLGVALVTAFGPRLLQYSLITAIAVVLLVPIVWRAVHHRLDPLEPIFWFSLMWALQFVLRPLNMLSGGSLILRDRYDVSTGVTRALVLGLVGAVALQVAYEASHRRAPVRPTVTTTGLVAPGWLAISLTTLAATFGMVSLFGSNNAEATAATGAYLYFLPLAATPAIVMLLLRRDAGSNLALAGATGLFVLSIVFSLSYGQRAFVLLPITAVLIYRFLKRGTRPSILGMAAAALLLFLPIFTVLEVARDEGATNPLTVLGHPQVRPGPAVSRFVAGDTTAMFPALALEVRTEGVAWNISPGSEIISIVTRPVPSKVWATKPLSSSEQLYADYFPENYEINKAGTLFTLVGEFYYDSGLIGVVVWMAVVGFLLARLWSWVQRDPSDAWRWALYAPMFMICVIGFRGDLALTSGISLFIVGPLFLAWVNARRRAKRAVPLPPTADLRASGIVLPRRPSRSGLGVAAACPRESAQ